MYIQEAGDTFLISVELYFLSHKIIAFLSYELSHFSLWLSQYLMVLSFHVELINQLSKVVVFNYENLKRYLRFFISSLSFIEYCWFISSSRQSLVIVVPS